MASQSIRIRNAAQEERDLLATIAYAAKAQWGYAVDTLEKWIPELTPSTFSIARDPTFVAEIGSEVVGWCQIDMESNPVELAHLWVHPTFQRRGVGRALLDAVSVHLRSVNIATLAIDADPNAEGFYVSIGASRQGLKKAPIAGHPSRIRPQLLLPLQEEG